MISYNDQDAAFAQRIKKEMWTKEELKDFGSYCNGDTLRTKYNI